MSAGGLSVKRQKARLNRSTINRKGVNLFALSCSAFYFLSFEVQPDIVAHPVS